MENHSSTKVVKAGAGYVIGNYLVKGITFLSAPIFTRLLTTAEFGDFNTYISYEAIIYILVGLALHSSVNNAKYKYGNKLNEYVSAITLFIILSALLWLGVANAFFDFYKGWFWDDRLVVNMLIVHCLCSALLQVYNAYNSLNYSYKLYVKICSFNAVFNLALSIVLMLTLFEKQRSLGRIIGTVIPMLFVGIYIVYFFFKKAKPAISKDYWIFGLKYSLPVVPHGISQVVLSSFDRIMIKSLIGAAEAGIYSFAYTIYTLFRVVATSLENVWKPWVYERMDTKDYEGIRKQGSRYALGMAVLTSLVIVVSPELTKILGDREYWDSTECVVPVMIGGFFAFLYTLPSVIEYFYGKTKFIAIGTMLAAGTNVLLNYVFIPCYGYIAAAYTTFVTYALYFIFHAFFAKKIHGSNLLDIKRLLLISFGVIVIGGCTILLEDRWIVRWILGLIIGLAGLLWGEHIFGISKMIRKKMAR